MKHYLKVCARILRGKTPFSRVKVLVPYLGLLIRSIYFHKVQKKHDVNSSKVNFNLLGYQVASFSYPQLINLFEEIFAFNVYSFEASELPPFIIDCGSNIGVSILYFKAKYPDAKILAFEPDPETFELLDENVRANNLNGVELLNVALSDQDSKVHLFAKPAPGSLTMSLFKSEEKTETKSVIAKRLSGYINSKVSLLKIDVEGSEVRILKDLVECDKIKWIDQMIIEYHPAITGKPVGSLVKLLESVNFKCTLEVDAVHPGATEVIIRAMRS